MICLSQSKCFQIATNVTGDAIQRRTDPEILRQIKTYQRWRIVGDIIWGCKRFDAAGGSELDSVRKISRDTARRVHA
jgi:hypothetical protein